nr:MAG: ORF1 [Torque teno virus]UGV43937.1 MAG: ORF1 [Torque teno virus]UGV43953.1 MAG: ORF1 [Torque teno virus]UGV43963.1 MAG: ORF1 [Torque teno virus]UGV44075.1 MAG: ORF1 [Torque teno virus]
MAWGWWRRRWTWPRRRRWRQWRRRRRVRTRRPRRPVRRRRQRRVRRRFYRGRRRGWRRRRYIRRRRRLRRKKLVLTQWQPATRRKCVIKGVLPLVWCGYLRSGRNYALHSDDTVKQGEPFGGSLSTTSFNLRVLYDQHQRGLNRWTFPNDQLDLARYKGCKFTFYRNKNTDFIAQYDIVAPYALDKNSSPSYAPGIMMQAKNKILIPSYNTKPRGRQKITVKIPPPKLFVDKWYSQEDLCSVNLVSLAVSAADFVHPFGSPQTDNPCVTFQVCESFLNSVIGFSSTKHQQVLEAMYEKNQYWASHLTPYFVVGLKNPYPSNKTDGLCTSGEPHNATNTLTTQQIKICADTNYQWYPYNMKKNKDTLNKIRQQYFEWLTTQAPTATQSDIGMPNPHPTPTNNYYEYHLGLFSPIFIGPTRTNNLFPAAYFDCTYNPLNDKGIGNHVWFQYNSKADTQIATTGLYCHIEDKPLWAALYGYEDFVESVLGPNVDAESVGLVIVICPYTIPPLYDKKNPNMGWIFYDTKFGNGKWIDGRGHIPIYWQTRWRPEMMFQHEVIRDIVQTGPFSYKDELKNSVLVAKYKFYFTWGGNMVSQQSIRNPCKTDGHDSDSNRYPRDVQIVDPLTMGPRWVFHAWDWRRGYVSEQALKRVSEKPLDYEEYFKKPKRPRIFPSSEGADQSHRLEEDSSSEEERSLSLIEETTPAIQEQFRKQLKRQQRLGQQLKLLQLHLLKTQAGLQINPLLFTHA